MITYSINKFNTCILRICLVSLLLQLFNGISEWCCLFVVVGLQSCPAAAYGGGAREEGEGEARVTRVTLEGGDTGSQYVLQDNY
jgi:hypothetical protein